MKAKGITDSLRAAALAKVQLVIGWYESNTQGIIEEACMHWAMAEERERVLREALFLAMKDWANATSPVRVSEGAIRRNIERYIALATPAPEPVTPDEEHAQ